MTDRMPDSLLDAKKLAAYLREHNLPPLHRFGQHFLIDEEVLQAIVDASATDPTIPVMEIGAGLGVLTRALAREREQRAGDRGQGATPLIAVELDRRLIPLLKERTKEYPSVHVVHADILKLPVSSLLPAPWPLSPHGYDVIGNIPYNITAPILKKFLTPTFATSRGSYRDSEKNIGVPRSLGEGGRASVGVADHLEREKSAPPRPRQMTLLADQSVAEAIAATPPHMSIRAISVQVFAEPTVVRASIPPSAFLPPPEVSSAILLLHTRPEPLVNSAEESRFFRLVRAGFSQKRKTLANALAATYRIPAEATAKRVREAGIDPSRRAQTLSIPEWIQLLKSWEAPDAPRAP
ncbi:MAG: 16S rRNA (adenine1518-N6/adenine1519-N6)-dimethyltransferase [Parcubacteria group bacterium Gr01-1014_106]|nr:MAG: 16S rRNA (adenine1518-N6/adenine1519-N6)-dimethyltransferase [Parcubacteria group bacterium Gr01-1014_106]